MNNLFNVDLYVAYCEIITKNLNSIRYIFVFHFYFYSIGLEFKPKFNLIMYIINDIFL